MKKLFTCFLTVLGIGFPFSADSFLVPSVSHPCLASPIHIPLFREEYSQASEESLKSNEILSWIDHKEYCLTIRPEDTWESLTQELQKYQCGITIEEVIEQAYNQPRVLNLVPGERVVYSDGGYYCSDRGYGLYNLL